MPPRARIGFALIVLAMATAIWAAVTAIAGGVAFDVLGAQVSSRGVTRPLAASLLLFISAAAVLGPAGARRAVVAIAGPRGGRSARVALSASFAVLVFALAWNTRAAGGSDSSCYVLQADAFARGHVTLAHPLASTLSGAPPAMFAPTGFVPSRVAPFAPVPICGAGLALAMTPFALVNRDAVFLVVPLFAALAVWLTFVIGRQMDDGITGACAAVLLALSPVFLYQSVQPMSDVPATALWLAALALVNRGDARGDAGGGVCASLAVLTRPNTLLIVLLLVALLPRQGAGARARATGAAWRRFAIGSLPALIAMAALNGVRYGSPLSSGYGSTDALFSVAHIVPNLARYPRWLADTETPFIALALLSPWWARRHPARARLALVLLAAVVLTMGTYLAYTVFDDWWYTRFLLPALPPAIVLAVAVVLERWPRGDRRRGRALVATALCIALGGWYLHVARVRHVFDLQALESRFVVTGRYVARALPANAVFLAVQQSGSLRHHGGRPTIAWDAVPRDGLDALVDRLRAAGLAPYIALEDEELPRFRARFAGQRAGALDWPPGVEVHAATRVRLYDPRSREAFVAGARVTTIDVR